jgi:hypothetical protein
MLPNAIMSTAASVALRAAWLMVLLSEESSYAFIWPPSTYPEQYSMQTAGKTFSMNITPLPLFNTASHSSVYLNIRYFFDCEAFRQGHTILTIPQIIGNVPNSIESLSFSDDWGELPTSTREFSTDNEISWITRRDCKGRVTVQFTCYPRNVTDTTPSGPRVDLRSQHSGLIGAGINFLPLPPREHTKDYGITVDCNKDTMDFDGTCASSLSLGSLPANSNILYVISNSVFAFGNMTIYSPSISTDGGGAKLKSPFRCIWFIEPPFRVRDLCKVGEEFYQRLTTIFGEPKQQYSLFFRQGIDQHFSGGTAFSQASILEYDKTKNESLDDLFLVLAHELVHNWPLMTECTSRNALDNVLWFTEGQYAIFFLHFAHLFTLRYCNVLYASPPFQMETCE